MPITPNAVEAATALFNQKEYQDKHTQVTVKKGKATLSSHGNELAQLTYDPPTLKVKNCGIFTPVHLDRINAVLRRAGHELIYRTNWDWRFENSQVSFGAGKKWLGIKL